MSVNYEALTELSATGHAPAVVNRLINQTSLRMRSARAGLEVSYRFTSLFYLLSWSSFLLVGFIDTSRNTLGKTCALVPRQQFSLPLH